MSPVTSVSACVQDRKYDQPYLARDLNGFGLIAGQHLGGVTGIANLGAKRSQPSCTAQGGRNPTAQTVDELKQRLLMPWVLGNSICIG